MQRRRGDRAVAGATGILGAGLADVPLGRPVPPEGPSAVGGPHRPAEDRDPRRSDRDGRPAERPLALRRGEDRSRGRHQERSRRGALRPRPDRHPVARERAGTPRHRVLARRTVPVRGLHGYRRQHPRHPVDLGEGGRRAEQRARRSCSSASPTRITTGGRSPSGPTGTCTSRSATVGARATHITTARTSEPTSRRSCASGPRRAAHVPTRSRATIRSSAVPARGPRSGPTACATRGGSRSTGRPATCGSATSGKTSGRRSTSSRPARRVARTTAGA